MTSARGLLPLLAVLLLVWEHEATASAIASSSSKGPESPSTLQPPLASLKTPTASGVIIDEAGARRTGGGGVVVQSESREKTRVRDPPGSPVNLFMPDEFQFYTLNANGQLVMKQMTKQEIQGMIAAGGGSGGLPVDLGHHQTQLPVGEPKVADVVQNVQKVLKDELNKPIQVPTAESSIPGSVNSQWTNMLPYILSGGSVDQQDVAQDASIILPTLDADQSYVDVVPLKGGKPEPETNYIPIKPASNEQNTKLHEPKPTAAYGSGKPISLLGNMALDSGILEKHEYPQLTRPKPSRLTTTPSYHKYTTTKSPSIAGIKDTFPTTKNSSNSKPTLYIPLSVSPSLLADAQIQDSYDQTGNANIHVIPEYVSKPMKDRVTTKLPSSEPINGNILKKPTTYGYADESGFTRVPMIQVPVISADKISSTTLRTNQQQTPMFEILPTISPGSMTSTTLKDTSHPSKINLGPMGGFKKPDISYKPTTPHRPVYEPTTKPSTANVLSTLAYHPVYESDNKPSTINPASPTYRPVYEPTTKATTSKTVSSTYRPVFEPVTKTSTANLGASQTYRPVYEAESTFKPTASPRPNYETSTGPNERFKVTQYPSSTYTTRKATSLMPGTETKTSTPSGLKVVQAQVQDNLPTVSDYVTKASVQGSVLEVTKSSGSVQKPADHAEEKTASLVPVVHQAPQKHPEISASQAEVNDNSTKVLVNVSAPVNKSESTTESVANNSFEQNTVIYQDTTYKLSDNISDSTDKDANGTFETTLSDKIESDGESSTLRYESTDRSTPSFALDTDQESLLKTEEYPISEDSSSRPAVTVQPVELKTDNYEYNTVVTKDATTKEPDMLFKETDNAIVEQTETIIPELINAPVNKSEESEEDTKYIKIVQKETTDPNKASTQFIPIDETTTPLYISISNKEPTAATDKQETTFVPLNDGNFDDPDSTKDYSILVDFIQSMSNIEINSAEPDFEIGGAKNEPVPMKNNSTSTLKDSDKILAIKNTTKPIDNNEPLIVSLEKGADATVNYQPVKLTTEIPNKSTPYYSQISTLEKDSTLVNANPTKEASVTPLYEKMEIITDNTLSKDQILEITSLKKQNAQSETNKSPITTTDSNKELAQDDEMSTVRVIPIYDDETIMYTIPPDAPGKTTFAATSTEKSAEETKATNGNDIPSTDLPDLQETFNNYMKEHYDSKLSTTDSYDEISRFTTFPTISLKNSPDYKQDTANVEDTTVNSQQKIPDHLLLNTESTVIPNYQEPATSDGLSKAEDNKESKPEPTLESSTVLTDVSTKSSTETKQNGSDPLINTSETTSLKPSKLNSTDSTEKKRINDSEPANSKTKSPIVDVEKIIADAPVYTSSPSIVQYTLSDNYSLASNIASGLIAGYPTYNGSKPMKEYMTTTVGPLKTSEVSDSNKTSSTLKLKSEDGNNVTSNDKVNRETPLTSNEENKKISSDLAKIGENPSNESLGLSKNESDASVSSPAINDTKVSSQTEVNDEQINSSFIPPLEKLSDLINQLKNSPDDYPAATTIVPLDNYETIFNETSTSASPSLPTATFESASKTSSDFENNTYVMLPTLPSNYTYNINQSSTKPATFATSTTLSSSTKAAAQNGSTSSYSSEPTSAATTPKQYVTEKPRATTTTTIATSTTFKTTKGPIEKVQSTIDKSAGRINLEEEKIKLQQIKPTEPTKYTMKNKVHYSSRRPANEAHQSYTRKATKATSKTTSPATTPTTERTTTKPSEDAKDNSTEKWTLIPQPGIAEQAPENKKIAANASEQPAQAQQSPQIVSLDHSSNEVGLDQSNKGLDKDVAEFLDMCNELSFKFWHLVNTGMSPSRSISLSPFGMISTLAMIFLGARGTTSNQMNDILKLDDVVTFNPHLVFQNITDTVTLPRGQGIENAAFVRALFADRLKVRRIMPFYKEQAQQFYEGAVVDINFSTAGDILRRRTNLLIRKQTGGRIKDFVKTHTVPLRSPLTALSANVFQTSCDGPDASSEGRDGEMYFALAQTVKQRKLVPIPAVVWKSGVSAGYEPSLDATAVALSDPKRPVAFIVVMPGQQGVTAPGDNLERLENRLFNNPGDALEKLLKVIIPRRVEVQMPKFSHRSIVNVTSALKKMGFEPLFGKAADLKGINGAGHDLYLADMIQMNLFCTCGDENKLGNRHLSETYPGTSPRHTRTWEIINNNTAATYDNLDSREPDNSEASESRCDDGDSADDRSESEGLNDEVEPSQQSGKWDLDRVNNLRQKMDKKRIRWFMPSGRRRCRNRRQTKQEKPRMRIDKPFLYLIRHNHSGLILHIGRFNPKSQS